jgi:hypothetical protein
MRVIVRHCSLTDNVTFNFNNTCMYTAAVFLDIEKAVDTTWHRSLLYKLFKLEFSINTVKLSSSFFSEKFQSLGRRRNVKDKRNSSRGATRNCSVPCPVQLSNEWHPSKIQFSFSFLLTTLVHTRHIVKRDVFSESCSAVSIHCIRGVNSRTNINEHMIQAIYFSHRLRTHEGHLTLNGRNIPFLHHVKYLGVIFDRKIL